jgi:hypothetical protein
MADKLEHWVGKKVFLEGSGCPTEGVLKLIDENGVLIEHIFIPWHKIDAILLPEITR